MTPWSGRKCGFVAAATLALMLAAPARPATAQTTEAVDRSALRVCADPNNLPFSNEAGEGFENRIAEVLAGELGIPVRYTWFPDTVGFVRNTLRARKCDLVMASTTGNEQLQNTNPYYHSAYSMVYRSDSGLDLKSLDDPVLAEKEIGIIAGTPPATLLAMKGLLGHSHAYQLLVDTRFFSPAHEMVSDVVAGNIDVGILWGPIAGYYARRESAPLTVVPLKSEGPVKLDFLITMGVRNNEPEWKREINRLIRESQDEINRILAEYGVPLLDDKGEPLALP